MERHGEVVGWVGGLLGGSNRRVALSEGSRSKPAWALTGSIAVKPEFLVWKMPCALPAWELHPVAAAKQTEIARV